MKTSVYTTVTLLFVLTSCSVPRYTYFFDQHHYFPKNEKTMEEENNLVLPPNSQMLTASSSGKIETIPVSAKELHGDHGITGLKAPVLGLNEKTELSREGKLQRKGSSTTTTDAPMEKDLKRSIIFGATGVVALILGGSVLWVLGSLSLLIGLIFLIKWTMRR